MSSSSDTVRASAVHLPHGVSRHGRELARRACVCRFGLVKKNIKAAAESPAQGAGCHADTTCSDGENESHVVIESWMHAETTANYTFLLTYVLSVFYGRATWRLHCIASASDPAPCVRCSVAALPHVVWRDLNARVMWLLFVGAWQDGADEEINAIESAAKTLGLGRGWFMRLRCRCVRLCAQLVEALTECCSWARQRNAPRTKLTEACSARRVVRALLPAIGGMLCANNWRSFCTSSRGPTVGYR